MSLKEGKEREKIKAAVETTRLSLNKAKKKEMASGNTHNEINDICENLYHASEDISSDGEVPIEKHTIEELLVTTAIIKKIKFDLEPIARTISAKTLEIEKCLLSQEASAKG
jgi:hypothetical protein